MALETGSALTPGRPGIYLGPERTSPQYEAERLCMSNETRDAWLTAAAAADTTGRISAPIDDVFLPGDVLADKYEIIDILGEGGFGVVYHGRQLEMGRDVAVKTLRRSILDYEEAALR